MWGGRQRCWDGRHMARGAAAAHVRVLLVLWAWLVGVCLVQVEVLEYPELGMEAIWRIEVENFPAFIMVDPNSPEEVGDYTGCRP